MKHGFHSEVNRFLESGKKSQTVTLQPNAHNARQCKEYSLPSDPIPVRLVRAELTSGEVEMLATSLLDEATYPTCWFRKLYQQRWAVEENYKREKQRLEGSSINSF